MNLDDARHPASAAGTRERWPRPALLTRAQHLVPRGGVLPEAVWESRHRVLVVVASLHVPVLLALALCEHRTVLAALAEAGPGAVLVVLAARPTSSQRVRSSAVTLSLLCSTAALIHLSGGLIELHFHFFVVIALVALYQSWTPYLLALAFVLGHHALMGVMMPEMVYNHPAAIAHPGLFALLHGAFVLAESLACLTYWRGTEDALDAERAQRLAVEDANVALSAANRQITDLVAMMSHDLRTPVTVINGFADTALESWTTLDDATRHRFMRKVGLAGHSLQQMLEETLTVSGFDAEGLEARPVDLRLDDSARSMMSVLSDPLPDLDLSDLERVVAYVDRGHFTQIFANLVTNAAKYGAAPYAVRAGVVGDTVELALADSGPGVPAEFLPRLFERYARSEEARRGDQRGSGLGLYIVRRLAEGNGGSVRCEPTPGGGATFVVTLPRGRRPEVERAEAVVGPYDVAHEGPDTLVATAAGELA